MRNIKARNLNIQTRVLWEGRSDSDKSFFHPRPTVLGNEGEEGLLMTLQRISGSDYFHPVMESSSNILGENWSDPKEIPGFGRIEIDDDVSEGVCDVVPTYHSETDTILAMGHNVYYKEGELFDSMGDWKQDDMKRRLCRFPVYTVKDKDGLWQGIRKKLVIPDLEGCSIYSSGCSQRINLEGGDFLMALTYGVFGRKDRMVCSVRCKFDGENLIYDAMGNTLELPVGRGLLEPSLVCYKNKYYITIRAEDNQGYVSISNDGLQWNNMKAWAWENGECLQLSTTQQHFLEINQKLYLVYTRKSSKNINVMRWRAPLYIAEIDVEKLCLIKESEQIVFPLTGDGVGSPQEVGLMGNFHPLQISRNTALVTVGEMLPLKGFVGNTLQAIISSE